jgi:hypothetical protein
MGQMPFGAWMVRLTNLNILTQSCHWKLLARLFLSESGFTGFKDLRDFLGPLAGKISLRWDRSLQGFFSFFYFISIIYKKIFHWFGWMIFTPWRQFWG